MEGPHGFLSSNEPQRSGSFHRSSLEKLWKAGGLGNLVTCPHAHQPIKRNEGDENMGLLWKRKGEIQSSILVL